MRRLSIAVSDQQLTLRRDRRKDSLCLSAVCACAVLLVGLCFVRVVGGWSMKAETRLSLLTMGLLSCAAFAWRLGLNLRRQEWVMDRVTEQVFLNGRPVEALGELESVCLDRSYYHEMETTVLYLRTRSRVSLEIARDGLFGVDMTEMQEAADAFADFAGLNLVTRDGFRPGRYAPAGPLTGFAGLSGKRLRKSCRRPVRARRAAPFLPKNARKTL